MEVSYTRDFVSKIYFNLLEDNKIACGLSSWLDFYTKVMKLVFLLHYRDLTAQAGFIVLLVSEALFKISFSPVV